MGTCTRAFCIVVYTEVLLLDSIVSHSVVGYYYNEVVLSKKLRTAVFHDSSLSLVWRKEKQLLLLKLRAVCLQVLFLLVRTI